MIAAGATDPSRSLTIYWSTSDATHPMFTSATFVENVSEVKKTWSVTRCFTAPRHHPRRSQVWWQNAQFTKAVNQKMIWAAKTAIRYETNSGQKILSDDGLGRAYLEIHSGDPKLSNLKLVGDTKIICSLNFPVIFRGGQNPSKAKFLTSL